MTTSNSEIARLNEAVHEIREQMIYEHSERVNMAIAYKSVKERVETLKELAIQSIRDLRRAPAAGDASGRAALAARSRALQEAYAVMAGIDRESASVALHMVAESREELAV
jgi:hypothetical protein